MKLASILTLVVTVTLASNAAGWAQSAEPSTASPNVSDPAANGTTPYGAVTPGSSAKSSAKPGLVDPLGTSSTTSPTEPSGSGFGSTAPSNSMSPVSPGQQPYGSMMPSETGTPVR